MSKKNSGKAKNNKDIRQFFTGVAHPIYAERLREEISLVDKDQSEGESVNNEEVAGRKNADDDSIENSELKEKIDILERENSALKTDNELLQKKSEKLLKDNQALKKLLDAAKNLNLYKDMHIHQLKLKLSENPAHVAGAEPSILFEKFQSNFSEPELKNLRSIGKGQRRDTAFIMQCIHYLYGGNSGRISKKCAGSKIYKQKTPITPEKKMIMEAMLTERVESEGIDEATAMDRCGRFNRLIGDGIHNITKRPTHCDANFGENQINTNSNASDNQAMILLELPVVLE